MSETRWNIPNNSNSNKDNRSFRPASLAEINAIKKYQPLVIKYTKRNGSPTECNIGCGNSLEDLLIIFSLYTVFYCFLLGFFALLLKGAIDTSTSSTLLWTFFFFGIFFVIIVAGAVNVGMWKMEREKKDTKTRAKAKSDDGDEMEV